jgi:hypothetical protein
LALTARPVYSLPTQVCVIKKGGNRRLTRLCLGFSKILENLKYAVAPHFAWYNFVRIHGTVKMTPAMAAETHRSYLDG